MLIIPEIVLGMPKTPKPAGSIVGQPSSQGLKKHSIHCSLSSSLKRLGLAMLLSCRHTQPTASRKSPLSSNFMLNHFHLGQIFGFLKDNFDPNYTLQFHSEQDGSVMVANAWEDIRWRTHFWTGRAGDAWQRSGHSGEWAVVWVLSPFCVSAGGAGSTPDIERHVLMNSPSSLAFAWETLPYRINGRFVLVRLLALSPDKIPCQAPGCHRVTIWTVHTTRGLEPGSSREGSSGTAPIRALLLSGRTRRWCDWWEPQRCRSFPRSKTRTPGGSVKGRQNVRQEGTFAWMGSLVWDFMYSGQYYIV